MRLGKFFQAYSIIIVVFFCCAFSVARKDVVGGFVTLGFTCLLVTFVGARLFLKESKLRRIILASFLLKLLIGIIHFLVFYDANYFEGNGVIMDVFQADFTSYFDFVSSLAHDKESHGVFYYDASIHKVSHQELLNFICIFMYKFGVCSMNIIPLNCLFSSLCAINLYICLEKYCSNKEKKTGLMWLLVLFPLFLDDAIFVRDITGQFIMSFGVVMYALSSDRNRFAWLIPVSLLFYLQRTAYIIVPFVVYMTQSFLNKKQTKYLIFVPFVMIAVALFMPEMGRGFGDEVAGRSLMSTSIVMLPVRIIFGLIGPFPWTQFIVLGLVEPAYTSQLYNYFAGIIHIGTMILLLSTSGLFKELCKYSVFLIGLIVVGMGVLDSHMHITYIMAGSYFIVPLIYLFTDSRAYKKAMLTSFLILLTLNILWLSLGMSGLKTGII